MNKKEKAMQIEEERKRFEAWFLTQPIAKDIEWFKRNGDTNYALATTQCYWEGWQAAKASAWRPISEAPKDGTSILLYCSNIKIVKQGRFVTKEEVSSKSKIIAGFMCDEDLCIPINQEIFTHFQYLPEPPQTGE